MATRGTTIRYDSAEKLTLLRPMVTRRYELTADHVKCCGCRICETVCPREAISLSAAVLDAGRLAQKPKVDIDPKRCSFCGECVALCPTHALSMTVNGVPEVPVIRGQAFPVLDRSMKVNQAALQASTDTSYVEACPVGAISAISVCDEAGTVTAVEQVSVDEATCINCTRCMEEGPQGGFTVTKPYRGRATLNTALCPAGCQACADVCPTRAITYDGAKVSVDRRFCLFCGACEKVCPVEGAVHILRTGIAHAPIESGAWVDALGKLVSYSAVSRELDTKGQNKRRKLLLGALNQGE
ncbi:MAG: 4Fe-4S binding protein [Anaerolineae bacterium]